ncbi:unnamed protein product, partial [Cladocopium goreaui]
VCPVNVDDASAPDWTGIATTDALWTETLSGTVDEVWSCWTSDVEKWLLAAGCLQQKSPERPLGSEPKAVHGQHRMADQQDVTERRLRRHIRRLQDLEDHWTTIFGQQDWNPEPFWQLYAEDLPPRRRAPKLPPINCAQIKKVAMQLRRKAYGPDGVSAQMLLQLPQPALIRAGQRLAGVCLDYKKAFDSADYRMGIQVLERLGAPSRITSGCFTISGVILGVLQLFVSFFPLRQQKRQVAGADALLFPDDRTIVAQDVPTLKAAERCWDRLGEVSRMETQRAKTQYWARTLQAYAEFQREGIQPQFQVQILGVTCGLQGRSMSSEEEEKAEKCKRLASRIAVLPKALRFKASLCFLILSPIFTWGVFLGGHYPNVKFCKSLKTNYFLPGCQKIRFT